MSSCCDRLSSLPDDLIHKILSFIGIKHAIKTSVLSSRWRYIWTSMPYLNFLTWDSHRLPKLPEFVTHVLSARDNQTTVSSIQLYLSSGFSQVSVKRILNYASSHNIQQLDIYFSSAKPDLECHFSVFSSQSLKNLTLTACSYKQLTPPTWELPALTTLSLYDVKLHDDNTGRGSIFSKCANLKNLTLKSCELTGLDGFNICHPRLSSLTLEWGRNGVNVVTPQLNNLTINHWREIHVFSAPNLSTLLLKDNYYWGYHGYNDLLKLPNNLLYLEKVDICVTGRLSYEAEAYKIVRLLKQLHSVKFLSLNLEIVKILSKRVELISHQPSPFTNLKSVKIYPYYANQPEEETVSTEVKNYLLDSSPGATFTMVSHKVLNYLLKPEKTSYCFSLLKNIQLYCYKLTFG